MHTDGNTIYIKEQRNKRQKACGSENLYRQLDKWIMLSIMEITETSEVHKMSKPLENNIVGEASAFTPPGQPKRSAFHRVFPPSLCSGCIDKQKKVHRNRS